MAIKDMSVEDKFRINCSRCGSRDMRHHHIALQDSGADSDFRLRVFLRCSQCSTGDYPDIGCEVLEVHNDHTDGFMVERRPAAHEPDLV